MYCRGQEFILATAAAVTGICISVCGCLASRLCNYGRKSFSMVWSINILINSTSVAQEDLYLKYIISVTCLSISNEINLGSGTLSQQ